MHYAKAMELGPLPCTKTHHPASRPDYFSGTWVRIRNIFEDLFKIPPVVCATGHVIDPPGGPFARFPATRENSVRLRIQALLKRWDARLGYSGAAGGADLIFAETIHALGGETCLILPVDRQTFCRVERRRVGRRIIQRYHAALAKASSVTESPFSRARPRGGDIWDFGNRMILGNALRRASELETELNVLAVWDGKPGDGRGGTADMVSLARHCGLTVHVIDPMGDEIVKLPGLSANNFSPRSRIAA